MTERFLLAIDNGSQSTKVTIFDPQGIVHASAQRPLRPYDTSLPGHVVHPDDDLWDSIRATCREAIQRFPGDPSQITAIGLCTIRFCRALLNADGLLVEPVLSWMDVRVDQPHDPTDTRVAHVTTSSGYITGRLTGRLVDTRANYQGLWPIDQRTGNWSTDPAAYRATGMPRRLLLDLVSPGDLLGTVTPEAAAATGIPLGLPVYATANDKAVEALGCGLTNQDAVLLSLGTYIAAMTVGTSAVTGAADYWVNFAATPGTYLYESRGIRRGMWTVSWFRDLVADPVGPNSKGQPPDDLLDREAADVPPGSGGLMTLLDWLAPTEAPYRRGAFLGFDGTQGRGHIYRSILEGIALTMAGHITSMEHALGRHFETAIISGGGSRSDLMMQILANVLNRPAQRAGMSDAAGLGAAICAAVGSAVHPNWDAATTQMVTPGTTFTPRPQHVTAYRDIARDYARITEYTDPLFAGTTQNERQVLSATKGL
ncbi:MAG: FGGY-family carbohydrate kinase [Actinomycetota bacterium]|nr:FGGY-family carbohydrate kinase [Actinomycetota bacterium]